MANLNKLEELINVGVGGKSTRKSPPRPSPAEGVEGIGRELVRRAIGSSMSKITDNLFLSVDGRQTAAIRAGLFDVFIVESFAGAPFPCTPTERFLRADFPNTAAQYGSIVQYARSEVASSGAKDVTTAASEYLVASSLLLPLGSHSVTAAYSFFEFGADARRAVNAKNAELAQAQGLKPPRPLNRVNVENIFKVFASVARQAEALTPRNGSRLSIGMNRLYGGSSGMRLHDLLQILTEVATRHPQIDWMIISPKSPDEAVLHPFDYGRWLERVAKARALQANGRRRQKAARPTQQARRS